MMSEIVQISEKCVFHKLQWISTWFKLLQVIYLVLPPTIGSNYVGFDPVFKRGYAGAWDINQSSSPFSKNPPMPLNK